MKRISKYIILAALVVIPSILGGSSAKATAESDGAKTPYVIYHDNNGTVITRDAYRSGYTFDAAFPQFYTGPEYMNTGWNTKADGKGTTYKTGEKLSDLTEDLDLYPMLEKGFYVRFESNGGTPIQYQFVFSGGKATKPTKPTRTGYTFDNWYSDEGCTAAFDFGSTVNKDMKLYAKWIPATSPYKVKIWLENPNRGAGKATAADYTYYGTYTKTAATEAKNITYTADDVKSGTMEKKAAFVSKDGLTSQFYFLDDNYDSQALTFTNASLAAVNAKGVKADGTTELNVYLRCAEYYFKLKDATGLFKSVSYATGSYSKIRDGESVSNWIKRNNIAVADDFYKALGEEYAAASYRKRYAAYKKQGATTSEHTSSDDGAILPYTIKTSSWMNSLDKTQVITENFEFVVELAKYQRDYTYRIDEYVQPLEDAKSGVETYMLDKEKTFKRSSNYSDGFSASTYDNGGFTIKKIRLVDGSGKMVTKQLNNFWVDITTTAGREKYYPTGWYECIGGRVSGNYPPSPYKLERYFTRNHFDLNFETNTLLLTVNPITVYYEDLLKLHADKIVDQNGNKFVVGETQYTDDQKVVWIFRGWYKNKEFTGSPVDFDITEDTMPASNLTLYAKWEKLTIEATFDGNGGKVEGKDKVKKEQQSGDIPKRPSDPVPPEGMVFSCWTINGIPYDFTEPIYDNTELKASYYSKGKALKVTYDYGNGAGTVPVDSRKYLVGANPEILSPAADLVPPIGQKFSYWTDSEHHTYVPGDDFIIKDDTQLTAVYAEGDRIIIKKEGLKFGESAAFSVYDESEPAKVVNVILTGVDNTGSTVSQIVAVEFKTKNITVKELPWSWAYDAKKDVITKDVSKDGNVFTFTNIEKENAPLRDEAIKNNAIINAREGVTVNEWEKEKRNLGK